MAKATFLFQFLEVYLFVGHPLAAPSVDAVQLAILALDDARIRILVDGAILQGEDMTPMSTVIADGQAQWRTHTLGRARQGFEVVVDEHVPAIL